MSESSKSADAAQRVSREAAVQERVRDGRPDDRLVIDVDPHWNWQRERHWREAKAGRREECGRDQQLHELLCQLVVGAALHLLGEEHHTHHECERDCCLPRLHLVSTLDLELLSLLWFALVCCFSLADPVETRSIVGLRLTPSLCSLSCLDVWTRLNGELGEWKELARWTPDFISRLSSAHFR